MTRELTSLKNNKAKTSKKSKDSEKRCLKDDAIYNCECERLREKFVSLREEYQQQHGRAYDDYRARIEERIKSDPKTFFWICRLKEKAHFEGCLGSGLEDVWVPSDPGPEHVPDDLLARFSSLQMRLRAFCRIWMSIRVPAPMAYHRSF
jgi:hypothetical protein